MKLKTSIRLLDVRPISRSVTRVRHFFHFSHTRSPPALQSSIIYGWVLTLNWILFNYFTRIRNLKSLTSLQTSGWMYFILVSNSFQKRRRIGIWQRLRRCQIPHLSTLRMLKVNLPAYVKCTPSDSLSWKWTWDMRRLEPKRGVHIHHHNTHPLFRSSIPSSIHTFHPIVNYIHP